MNKKDLVNGSVVELRNGKQYIVIDDELFNYDLCGGHYNLCIFDDELISRTSNNINIMKVMLPTTGDLDELNAIYKVNKKQEWTWERKLPKIYYYAGVYGICSLTEGKDYDHMKQFTRMFDTEEEAEFEFERKKVDTELYNLSDVSRDMLNDLNEYKYAMCYEFEDKKIHVGSQKMSIYNIPYFSTRRKCQEAIDIIGEERLIKYYFGVR